MKKKRLVPIIDPVLGEVTFDPKKAYWRFNLQLLSGKQVPGTITPIDEDLPLDEQGLEVIVKRVSWLVQQEEALRGRIADKLFPRWLQDWYDPDESTVETPNEFANAISLHSIDVLEDLHPGLIYHDAGLYGGNAIVVTVGDDGETIYGPQRTD